MAYLPCDECGDSTNHQGSWSTPIKILCKKCSVKPSQVTGEIVGLRFVEKDFSSPQDDNYEFTSYNPMSVYCSCYKPWGVGGRCVICEKLIMITTL